MLWIEGKSGMALTQWCGCMWNSVGSYYFGQKWQISQP